MSGLALVAEDLDVKIIIDQQGIRLDHGNVVAVIGRIAGVGHDTDKFLLLQGDWVLELPGIKLSTIPKIREPILAAAEVLKRVVGYRARHYAHLGTYPISPLHTNDFVFLFEASGLEPLEDLTEEAKELLMMPVWATLGTMIEWTREKNYSIEPLAELGILRCASRT